MKSIALTGCAVFAFAITASQQPSPACSLLTPPEIEAVAGAKASDPVGGDQIVKAAGPQTHMCMWKVGQTGQLSLTAGPVPPGTDVIAMAKKNPGVDALKKAKYTTVEKEYGGVYCSVMSPPATTKDGMFLTSCAGGTKGKAVSLSYMSQTEKLDLDKTKGLLDKALGRQR